MSRGVFITITTCIYTRVYGVFKKTRVVLQGRQVNPLRCSTMCVYTSLCPSGHRNQKAKKVHRASQARKEENKEGRRRRKEKDPILETWTPDSREDPQAPRDVLPASDRKRPPYGMLGRAVCCLMARNFSCESCVRKLSAKMVRQCCWQHWAQNSSRGGDTTAQAA